jgi:hypothetical protein
MTLGLIGSFSWVVPETGGPPSDADGPPAVLFPRSDGPGFYVRLRSAPECRLSGIFSDLRFSDGQACGGMDRKPGAPPRNIGRQDQHAGDHVGRHQEH